MDSKGNSAGILSNTVKVRCVRSQYLHKTYHGTRRLKESGPNIWSLKATGVWRGNLGMGLQEQWKFDDLAACKDCDNRDRTDGRIGPFLIATTGPLQTPRWRACPKQLRALCG